MSEDQTPEAPSEALELGPNAPGRQERRALAAALRALDALCVESDAAPQALQAAAEATRAVLDALEPHGRRTARQAMRGGLSPADAHAWSDRGAVAGPANPIAPPLALRVEGERVIGEVTFDAQHGGAPGLVHGGLLAALLDELLGQVAIKRGVPVATATLNLHYVAPTPLGVPLHAEAWLERNAGRRYFLAGEIRAGELVTARADGVFVDVRGSSFSTRILENAAARD